MPKFIHIENVKIDTASWCNAMVQTGFPVATVEIRFHLDQSDMNRDFITRREDALESAFNATGESGKPAGKIVQVNPDVRRRIRLRPNE